MTLWEFFESQSDVKLPRLIAIAGLSGLSNALLLAVVNSAAHNLSGEGQPDLRMFAMFGVVITTYILTQRHILRVSSIEVEKIIARLRISLSDRIRQADLQSIEKLGRAQIYASMNTDTLTVSQATAPMIIACQGAILVLFSLFYIWVLSRTAFSLTLAIVVAGIVVHTRNRKELMEEMKTSSAKEHEFFDTLTHLIEGFKEVKLNTERSNDLFAHLSTVSGEVATLKTRTGVRYANYYIFTQVLFYLLIGSMVFILPGVSQVASEQVTRITAAILFIIGPLTMVVSAFPVFRTAEHAIQNIMRLQDELERAQRLAQSRENGGIDTPPPTFDHISLENVEFSYLDSEGNPAFTIGPLNLDIRRGETMLVVGGNGSGKSTLLKVLTGLYYPTAGRLLLDGMDVKAIGYRGYRELFSAVFADYHLFDQTWGMRAVEPRKVFELLQRMQLERKTQWQAGRFIQQDLSTGQKKRLALIISLLEERPIYVFDEWAADQDPAFRRFFYETLLPEMKERGRTIIAATHDDRYFHVGDRVVKMEIGQIVSDVPKGEA